MRLEVQVRRRRKTAETLMIDTCTITRGTGTTFNPETGQYESAATPIYAGKCRLQSGSTQAANPEAGGAVFTVERLEIQLPFGTIFEVDDIVTGYVSASNPALTGNEYRVTGLGEKTHATAQRFTVEVHS